MPWRKIKLRMLFEQGVSYRLFVICSYILVLLVVYKDISKAFKLSIAVNAINISLYFIFHYVWGRLFKLGKDGGNNG